MTEAELFTLLGGVGGNAVLVLVIWALLTGRIVTRFHYDEMRRVMEQRIAIQTEVIHRLRGGDAEE